MAYDQPLIQSINIVGFDGFSTAGNDFEGQGPPGRKGRILAISAVFTTANSTAAGQLDIGTAADDDAYGSLACAAVQADGSALVATEAQIRAMSELAADTVFIISGSGGGTNGVADLSVTIGWF